MRTAIIGVLAIALIAGVTIIGCGPRAQVAADKIVAQIDKVLGELNVKLKKVENAYAELQTSTEGMREKRIDAKVRLEKLQEKQSISSKTIQAT